MALRFNGAWRFVPPADGTFTNTTIPTSALNEFQDIIRRVATQGELQDVLEHFKGYFCRAVGSAHVQSSNAGWAETDLRLYMEQAAENAPLFIEAMVEACRNAKELGNDFYAPDTSALNLLLARNNIGYEIIDDQLVLREEPTSDQEQKWYEKTCEKCGTGMSVHRDWEHPPQICANCKAEILPTETSESREQAKPRLPLNRGLSALLSGYDVVPKVKTTSRQLRVFLCHSSGDKPAVRNLYARLQEENIVPWLDEEDLLPGQDWDHEIPRAVRECDAVIVCLSRTAISKKGYLQKEIKCALDVAEEQPESTIFLIPLKLEECDVPPRLSKWQWVNYFDERGHQRLMRSLRERARRIGISVTRED
jgi:hypothetical protein